MFKSNLPSLCVFGTANNNCINSFRAAVQVYLNKQNYCERITYSILIRRRNYSTTCLSHMVYSRHIVHVHVTVSAWLSHMVYSRHIVHVHVTVSACLSHMVYSRHMIHVHVTVWDLYLACVHDCYSNIFKYTVYDSIK